MEKNESAEEREKETVETIEPNTEIISLEIETDNKEEEDEENGKVEKIPEQGNENTRRRVQFKLPMKTAGTGMTLRPKFKKVAETQVKQEKPTDEEKKIKRKRKACKTEKRKTSTLPVVIDVSSKSCGQFKREPIDVSKERKRKSYNKTEDNKDVKSENNKRTENQRMRNGGEGVSNWYPRRNVPVKDYTEEDYLDDDDLIFCDDCDREWYGDCPVHEALILIADTEVIKDENNTERALKTTPQQLEISQSEIIGGGNGVWTKCAIPPRVVFGPYEGVVSSLPDKLGYSWTIMRQKQPSHYVSGACPETSNWMRYVNAARYKSELNLFAFQYKGQIYYRTFEYIPPKCELKVWYGEEYQNDHLGITIENFENPNLKLIRNLVFPCGQCSLTFSSPLYLKRHRDHYCSEKKRPLKGESIKADDDESRASRKKIYTEDKFYSCDVCGKKFTHKNNIKSHMLTHTGERPYSCGVCSKKFTQSGNLTTHMRVHTGEKPYSCIMCNYKCKQSGHLKSHMLTHTEQKPFCCDVCNKTFTQRSNLKTHMRVHTGEKPYCCDVCSKTFTQKGNLKNHIKTHVGV